ncbi:uncharacterized protein LOC125675496 isoform X2 [Ostrea edulis]|uniref:uncharacterized protein LOC125675496 isoform X2 n=1 Tax=Ostrea edulis TaxID=37623 RepID=UPI0024AEAB8A|nr:uncharacterized protein LOC125675496 isoform X2 [Ostrea edulis]
MTLASMAMMYQYTVLVCLMVVVFAEKTSAEVEFHRIKVLANGAEVLEDVQYDKDNKVALLTVEGQQAGDETICQSTNFHDLERQLLALKYVNSGKCYLVHSKETPSQIESVFRNGIVYNTKTLSYKVRKNSVPAEHLEAQAGKKIANFCKDYDTKWLVEAPIISERSRLKRALKRSCSSFCVFCSFNLIE